MMNKEQFLSRHPDYRRYSDGALTALAGGADFEHIDRTISKAKAVSAGKFYNEADRQALLAKITADQKAWVAAGDAFWSPILADLKKVICDKEGPIYKYLADSEAANTTVVVGQLAAVIVSFLGIPLPIAMIIANYIVGRLVDATGLKLSAYCAI